MSKVSELSDELQAAGLPVSGVAFGSKADKSTWEVRFEDGSRWSPGQPTGTAVLQQTAAIVDGFDASAPDGIRDAPRTNGLALVTRQRKAAKEEARTLMKQGNTEAAFNKLLELIPDDPSTL